MALAYHNCKNLLGLGNLWEFHSAQRVVNLQCRFNKVSVELPASAVNTTLPTSAAAHHAVAPCCCGADRVATDRYLLPAGPTAANPLHAAAVGKCDKQTDGHHTIT